MPPVALACWIIGLLAVALPSPALARAQAPSAKPVEAARRALPALDHEPLLGVLIARAASVAIELAAPVDLERLDGDGPPIRLAAGTLRAEVHEAGLRLSAGTSVVRGPVLLRGSGEPVFALDALPEFGSPVRVRLTGDLLVRVEGEALEVIERVPMEDYLAGVVGAEMNPGWPPAALAAQAIVARSYAAARWQARSDRAWQLHWHFGVDMAYHGWKKESELVARAIAPTRGEVLMYRGFPVLALFHASSGGRTEAFERIKPGVLAADGRTPIAAAMPVLEDPAAQPGAAGLGLAATHGRWRTEVPLAEITRALADWSSASGARPRLGTVEGISIESRHADSGRAATVSIRHRLDGALRFQHLAATDFRLAVGPVRVRSLYWQRCFIAARPPDTLVLEGLGFGHGCGLSQVSAWFLARSGASAEAIVARFYPGARIERRY